MEWIQSRLVIFHCWFWAATIWEHIFARPQWWLANVTFSLRWCVSPFPNYRPPHGNTNVYLRLLSSRVEYSEFQNSYLVCWHSEAKWDSTRTKPCYQRLAAFWHMGAIWSADKMLQRMLLFWVPNGKSNFQHGMRLEVIELKTSTSDNQNRYSSIFFSFFNLWCSCHWISVRCQSTTTNNVCIPLECNAMLDESDARKRDGERKQFNVKREIEYPCLQRANALVLLEMSTFSHLRFPWSFRVLFFYYFYYFPPCPIHTFLLRARIR